MIRKIISISVFSAVILCGCKSINETNVSSDVNYINTDSVVSEIRNENNVLKNEDIEVVSQISPDESITKDESKPNDTMNNESKSSATQGKIETEKNTPVSNQDKVSNTSSNMTASVTSDTKSEITVTESEKDLISSKEKQIIEPYATESDAKKIADRMVEYINKYRNEQGKSSATTLPRLTEYAEYRSRQLIKNFAHDISDETKAATALKYGEYIDPQIFGISGEPYYRASVREAIMKGGYIDTVDVIAEKLALLTKSSSGHWSYVGSDEYMYIGIGVTYENGIWYSNISVSTTDKYD